MNTQVVVKITNGKQLLLENIKVISLNDDIDSRYYRRLKTDDMNIDYIEDHFIVEWFDSFITSEKLPLWLINSNILEIEVLHN